MNANTSFIVSKKSTCYNTQISCSICDVTIKIWASISAKTSARISKIIHRLRTEIYAHMSRVISKMIPTASMPCNFTMRPNRIIITTPCLILANSYTYSFIILRKPSLIIDIWTDWHASSVPSLISKLA